MEKEHRTIDIFMGLAKIFYKIILPAITIILLLGISQFLPRPRFLGSLMDFIIRVYSCVMFCIAYRGLVPMKKSLMYPTLTWSKADLHTGEKILCIILAATLGITITIITWWLFQKFVPIFGEYSIIPAVLNGLVFLIPSVIQYEKFRIM